MLLLCSKRAGPFIDLREPEIQGKFELVIGNPGSCPEPGPDLRDKPGLFLCTGLQLPDQGPLLFCPGGKVGNLFCGKPEFRRKPEVLRLLLPEPFEPVLHVRVRARGLLDPLVLGFLIGNQGKRGF